MSLCWEGTKLTGNEDPVRKFSKEWKWAPRTACFCPVGVDFKELPRIGTEEEYRAIRKKWRAGAAHPPYYRAWLGAKGGLSRSTFRLGGGCTWWAPAWCGRAGLALLRARFPAWSPREPSERPAARGTARRSLLTCPAPAAGPWWPSGWWQATGLRRLARRTAPSRRAATREGGCRRRAGGGGAGAPGPVPWRRPASHGSRSLFRRLRRARPAPPAPASTARPVAGARGSNTNTIPRFRVAAATGKRRGRADVQTRQEPGTRTGVPPSPREASGGRAPATWRLNPNKRGGSGRDSGQSPESTAWAHTLLAFPSPPCPARGGREPSRPPAHSRTVAAKVAFRGNSCSLGTATAPPPFPSWRQTESTNQ